MTDQPPPQQCVIPLHKPSRRELIFFFISGILVSVPMAIFFESLIVVPAVVTVVVLAPFIEELAKVFPLFYRHGESERSIVTLGILIGLGFGITEFFEYVVLLNVPPIVRIPAVIFHASSAGIAAFGIAKKNPLPFYLLSVFLHATNNFFAAINVPAGILIELIVVIAAYLLAYRFYHEASPEKIVV